MLLDMYKAMVYANATVGVFLGYAVAVFVGFLRRLPSNTATE